MEICQNTNITWSEKKKEKSNMWQWVSNIASIMTILSAIITLLSAVSMKKYYEKIVLQYSIEKMTAAEQQLQMAKRHYQQIKRLYTGNSRGINKKTVSNLFVDIDEIFDKILYSISSSYPDICSSITSAREQINLATLEENILRPNEYFTELGVLLDNIYSGVKLVKETGQESNAKALM